MAWYDGLAGAGVSAAGNLAGALLSNAASAKEAAKTRAFLREQAQNRYQWTMEDMRKAGLNPMLAYQQGAYSPQAGGQGRVSDLSRIGTEAVNTGRQVSLATQQKKLIGEQVQSTWAQGQKALAEETESSERGKLIGQQRQIAAMTANWLRANPWAMPFREAGAAGGIAAQSAKGLVAAAGGALFGKTMAGRVAKKLPLGRLGRPIKRTYKQWKKQGYGPSQFK